MSLQDRFLQTLTGKATSLALVHGGQRYSWGELAALARGEIPRTFDAAGIPPRTPVAMVARNRPSVVAAMIGLVLRHHRIILIDPLQRADRLSSIVSELSVAAVIACREDWTESLASAVEGLGAASLALDEVSDPISLRGAATGSGAKEPLPEGLLGLEIMTSGTTGPPKHILYSYATCEAAAKDACEALDLMTPTSMGTPDWPIIQHFPVAHIGGLYYVLQSAYDGQPQVLLDKFSVAEWVDAVSTHRPPILWLHPPGIRMVLDADVPSESLRGAHALRTGSAPLDDASRQAFLNRYGIPILGYFGATEFCGIVTDWTYDEQQADFPERRGSVGRARPGVELSVVNPANGEPLPAGKSGVLRVRAPRVGSEWLATNDLAHLDEKGYLFLEGRADSVVNRGGFKVSCTKVAEALRSHPAVAEICVIGITDHRLGEIPVAAVETHPGASLTEQELAEHGRRHLLSYEIPARFLLLPALPRAALSKVDQKAVRALFERSTAS